jgi:hypothetical protein
MRRRHRSRRHPLSRPSSARGNSHRIDQRPSRRASSGARAILRTARGLKDHSATASRSSAVLIPPSFCQACMTYVDLNPVRVGMQGVRTSAAPIRPPQPGRNGQRSAAGKWVSAMSLSAMSLLPPGSGCPRCLCVFWVSAMSCLGVCDVLDVLWVSAMSLCLLGVCDVFCLLCILRSGCLRCLLRFAYHLALPAIGRRESRLRITRR